MKKILILGYGNPMRGDDGLGWVAAQQLESIWQDNSFVDIEIVQQLTPEVVETLIIYDTAVLIDAYAEGNPGQVVVRELACLSSYEAPLNHHCTPESLLCMARQYYSYSPRAVIFSIVGKDFGHKEVLSEEVRLVLPSLVNDVNQFLLKELQQPIH